jgi:N-acetylneuraminic acid mutarotase
MLLRIALGIPLKVRQGDIEKGEVQYLIRRELSWMKKGKKEGVGGLFSGVEQRRLIWAGVPRWY